MVFYRKYRSQTVGELDLKEVREKLTSILQSKDIAHAFLFTGPRGLGKTSAARILAKAVNCERKLKVEKALRSSEPKDLRRELKIDKNNNSQLSTLNSQLDNIEPCNQCDTCISITNGSNIDVLEIDAASNRGIDEIRSLRERVKYAPSAASKKVYIIDEVHMLTNEAFNALLKTLEEPPAHVIFILCTTERTKIPQTILSRVFVVRFATPTLFEMRTSIQRIINGEKLEVEEGVVDALFALSQGSFRDAHKFLEELVQISKGKKITKADLESRFHIGSVEQEAEKLLSALAIYDSKEALSIIEKMNATGCDFVFVTEVLVGMLREHMLYLSGFESKVKKSPFVIQDVSRLLEMLDEAYRLIKTSVLPQLPLELAVIEWAASKIPKGKLSLDPENLRTEGQISNFSKKIEENAVPLQQSSNHSNSNNPDNNHFLYQLIDEVKKTNQTVAGLLRGCKVKLHNDTQLVLETPFSFHKDKLNEAQNLEVIESALGVISTNKIDLQIVAKVG